MTSRGPRSKVLNSSCSFLRTGSQGLKAKCRFFSFFPNLPSELRLRPLSLEVKKKEIQVSTIHSGCKVVKCSPNRLCWQKQFFEKPGKLSCRSICLLQFREKAKLTSWLGDLVSRTFYPKTNPTKPKPQASFWNELYPPTLLVILDGSLKLAESTVLKRLLDMIFGKLV